MEASEFQYEINRLIQNVGAYGAFPKEQKLIINGLALAGEAGEVANKLKKHVWYSPKDFEELRNEIGPELGDVAYHLVQLASELSIDLRDIFNQAVLSTKARNGIS